MASVALHPCRKLDPGALDHRRRRLGFLFCSNVTTGLLEAKERSAVGEASAGLGEAQRLPDAADTGPSTPSPSRLVDTVVTSLATRAGSPATFDVLLLSTCDIGAPERGTTSSRSPAFLSFATR